MAIRRTHTMLTGAQRERAKSTNDFKIKHSTLLKACTVNENNHPSQENPEDVTGSGDSIDYDDSLLDNENSKQSSCSCNEYDILLRHLRTCPKPKLELPPEINDLSVHYHEIEESIKIV